MKGRGARIDPVEIAPNRSTEELKQPATGFVRYFSSQTVRGKANGR